MWECYRNLRALLARRGRGKAERSLQAELLLHGHAPCRIRARDATEGWADVAFPGNDGIGIPWSRLRWCSQKRLGFRFPLECAASSQFLPNC